MLFESAGHYFEDFLVCLLLLYREVVVSWCCRGGVQTCLRDEKEERSDLRPKVALKIRGRRTTLRKVKRCDEPLYSAEQQEISTERLNHIKVHQVQPNGHGFRKEKSSIQFILSTLDLLDKFPYLKSNAGMQACWPREVACSLNTRQNRVHLFLRRNISRSIFQVCSTK